MQKSMYITMGTTFDVCRAFTGVLRDDFKLRILIFTGKLVYIHDFHKLISRKCLL